MEFLYGAAFGAILAGGGFLLQEMREDGVDPASRVSAGFFLLVLAGVFLAAGLP